MKSQVKASDYRVKMRFRQKHPRVTLKKYIATVPEVDVVPTSIKDGTTLAVARLIHLVTDPELWEVPDLEGYRQREGV